MNHHDLHPNGDAAMSQEELDRLKSMGLDTDTPLSDILNSILEPGTAPSAPVEPAPDSNVPVPAVEPENPPDDSTAEPAAPAPGIDLSVYSDLDTYTDSGEYRSYNGNREYRSFDASLPDASPDEWYHYTDEDMELDDEEPFEEEPTDAPPKKRRHTVLTVIAHMLLVIVTAMAAFYLLVVYSNIPVLVKARTMYIQTAMATLSHKWLATALLPSEMIDDVMRLQYAYDDTTVGIESDSNWGADFTALPNFSDTISDSSEEGDAVIPGAISEREDIEYSSPEEALFYEIFWELDYDSMSAYLAAHPEALANGWAGIDINEAGLDDDGTSIQTIYGDQVLAVNAADGITLVRIYLPSAIGVIDSRGVLAIAKDTSRLSLCPASTLGTVGQTTGRICEANNGILAINGSAFDDPSGTGNGGQLSGTAVCSGTVYDGEIRLYDSGYKRIELRNNGRMYIVDTTTPVGSDVREAAEFTPALIVDGKIVVDDSCGWTGPNPRSVLGQTNKLETMMVIVEGRYADGKSPGCSVVEVAKLMQQYGCVQALNLDGGTSAMMYYDGEYVTLCSNKDLPGGRTLPTAWVYR